MAELERLEGEMRRREKSFSDLLGELDRISAKCARLTASTAVGRAAPAGSSSTGTSRRQPQQGSGGLQVGSSCTDRHGKPSAQEHTTQCFGSLVAALASSGLPAAAAWADQAPGSGSDGSPGRGGQGDDGDWGWENLLAFEQQIREQQRKVGPGVGARVLACSVRCPGRLPGLRGFSLSDHPSPIDPHRGALCLQLVEQGVLPAEYA